MNMVNRVLPLFAALLLGAPALSLAASGDFPLQSANNDVRNAASLQRGAKYFVNYCLGCHSAQYVRYNRVARDLGISEDLLVENLMFTTDTVHDTMTIAMPGGDAEGWFGTLPPDLSLIARSRSADYLYTFLKAFYLDEDAVLGTNNKVLSNTSMPHVLWELQGIQRPVYREERNGDEITRVFDGFETVREGALSEEEYSRMVRDIVNFLDYIGEPVQVERVAIGIRVIAFLLVFLLIAWLLKREIWKDVK